LYAGVTVLLDVVGSVDVVVAATEEGDSDADEDTDGGLVLLFVPLVVVSLVTKGDEHMVSKM
jgi:hypothetical protein